MKAKFKNGIIVDYPYNIESWEKCRFFNWSEEEICQFVLDNFQRLPISLFSSLQEINSALESGDKYRAMTMAMEIDKTTFSLNFRFSNFETSCPYNESHFQLID